MRIGWAVVLDLESVDRPPGDLRDCRSRNGMDCMTIGVNGHGTSCSVSMCFLRSVGELVGGKIFPAAESGAGAFRKGGAEYGVHQPASPLYRVLPRFVPM